MPSSVDVDTPAVGEDTDEADDGEDEDVVGGGSSRIIVITTPSTSGCTHRSQHSAFKEEKNDDPAGKRYDSA